MTAPFRLPSSVSGVPTHSSQVSGSKEKTQMSLTKVLDPRQFKAFFAHRFSVFLHENYRNAEEVSVVFGVRYQTALNWWQGTTKPSGDTVAYAFTRHGESLLQYLEE